jgi:hypothetical protein
VSRPELVLVLLGLGADRAWGAVAGALAHPLRGPLDVRPGLVVDPYRSIAVEGEATALADVPVQVLGAVEDLGMTPARLARALPGLRAELWLIWPAGRSEQLVVGRLEEARVEVHRLTGTLRAWTPFWVRQSPLLETGAVVGPSTWPRTDAARVAQGDAGYVGSTVARDPGVEGQPYPVIIGAPAVDVPLQALGGGLTGSLPCAPQLVVEVSDSAVTAADCTILIAGHPIAATTIRRVARDANGATLVEDVAVRTRYDTAGRQVAVCSPGSALAIPAEGGTEAWTVLPGPAGTGLGMPSPFSPGPLRRAGEVLRWALQRSGLPLDPAGMVLPSLDAYLIDVAVWEQVGALDFARALLRWLPAELAAGPRGLRVVPSVRLGALPPSAARWTWTVGSGVTRVEAPLSSTAAPPSRISVGYALDARAGRSTRWVHVCAPGDPLLDDHDAVASPLLAEARVLPGQEGEVEVLDGAPTSDAATALRMALDVAERARASWSAVYAVWFDDGPAAGLPRAGDLVHLVDDELGWDVLAQVLSVEYAGSVIRVGLRWPG